MKSLSSNIRVILAAVKRKLTVAVLEKPCHINFAVTQVLCEGWRLVRSDLYKRHDFPTEIINH
jgi:hypothetical protein